MWYRHSLDLTTTPILNHCHKPWQLASTVRPTWKSIRRDRWPPRSTPLVTRAFLAVGGDILTTSSRRRHPDDRQRHPDSQRRHLNDRQRHPDRPWPAPTRQRHREQDLSASSPAWLGDDITPRLAPTRQRHHQHDRPRRRSNLAPHAWPSWIQ
jgi:hypothetical protein